MAKKRGLGKGLDALLGGAQAVQPRAEASATNDEAGDGVMQELDIEVLQPGKYQPRTGMDPEKLSELADSIKAQGLVQPIVVRAVSKGRYEIIAGERRWRAAQQAGLRKVPAVIREVPDNVAIALALIENIQRENLNPLEESTALKRLIEEFELTHAEAARAVGRSRAAVSNLLRLQELEPQVKVMVDAGELEMGHARALLALKGEAQVAAAHQVADRELSVRETEALVKRLQSGEKPKSRPSAAVDPDIQRLADDLTERICARVSLKHKSNGRGQIVIQYNNLDELDGILARIK